MSNVPSAVWLRWIEDMRLPQQQDGESDADWTDRIHAIGASKGRRRQCSIGWHDECSMRPGQTGCECPCHNYDKQDLWKAIDESERTIADLTAKVEALEGSLRTAVELLQRRHEMERPPTHNDYEAEVDAFLQSIKESEST